MTGRQPWLILGMDDGVIRREPTRRAAVEWMCGQAGGEVLGRHAYGPGAYEYHVGIRTDEESSAGYFVERLDAAVHSGWDHWFEIPDTYPYPDRPYDTDMGIDRDLLIEQMRRRTEGGLSAATARQPAAPDPRRIAT